MSKKLLVFETCNKCSTFLLPFSGIYVASRLKLDSTQRSFDLKWRFFHLKFLCWKYFVKYSRFDKSKCWQSFYIYVVVIAAWGQELGNFIIIWEMSIKKSYLFIYDELASSNQFVRIWSFIKIPVRKTRFLWCHSHYQTNRDIRLKNLIYLFMYLWW